MFATLVPNEKDVMPEHVLNVCVPILVTLFGIFIIVKEVHPEKAKSSMLTMLLLKVISVNPLH
jgi:hypothetical protein